MRKFYVFWCGYNRITLRADDWCEITFGNGRSASLKFIGAEDKNGEDRLVFDDNGIKRRYRPDQIQRCKVASTVVLAYPQGNMTLDRELLWTPPGTVRMEFRYDFDENRRLCPALFRHMSPAQIATNRPGLGTGYYIRGEDNKPYLAAENWDSK